MEQDQVFGGVSVLWWLAAKKSKKLYIPWSLSIIDTEISAKAAHPSICIEPGIFASKAI